MQSITSTERPAWRKSTHSGGTGGECVEMASAPGLVAIRDSKDPDGPTLVVSRDDFASLVSSLKQ
ncbi:DUF397 domain-containing protein [Actinomadura sp. NEAU-AAG7]|uniref:DUF397 domain-containing protein n=1 Tax=Actinomadura sp. NEAU-AAG7 TaxID=2839640 RepID=UPI001BE4BF31|nr:DUF397 domain-containing protein [Actinomadura sp. NEAU-AAG7]MBT2208448.1 DUF397 domain-containing protein [Actinomadura sp. NEAU-AAG7]